MEFVTFAQILVGGLGKEIDVIDTKNIAYVLTNAIRDAVQKKNVIFSDIVTIAFDPHPP